MPVVLFMMGRLDEALDRIAEAQQVNATVRNAGDAAWGLVVRAAVAAVRGDTASAEEYAEQAVETSRQTNFPFPGLFALSVLGYARCMRGHWSGARAAINRITEPGYLFQEGGGDAATNRESLALLDAYADELRVADDVPATALPTEDIGFDIAFLHGLCTQVEIAAWLQRPDLIRGVAEAIARGRKRGAVLAIGWPFLLRRIEGLAATLEMRWADAEEHFEASLEIAQQAGARSEGALAAFNFATMLARRNAGDDRAHASRLLDEYLPLLRSSCPNAIEVRAEKLADYLSC
jgi:tetratricopeptide (TPR) repeat protein